MTASATADDPAVLVVVVNDPADLDRALHAGWYRIPLARAPARIAVDHLAFYQTAAFPEGERWLIRWHAPVTDYRIVHRRDLLPAEPNHPRANDRYYRIGLGPPRALPSPVPSRRLRRITFIPTTLTRLLAAQEINDLWVKTDAQERLWRALQQADLDAECNFEIAEGPTTYCADFVLPCRNGLVVVTIEGLEEVALSLHEETISYATPGPGKQLHLRLPNSNNSQQANDYTKHISVFVKDLGGLA